MENLFNNNFCVNSNKNKIYCSYNNNQRNDEDICIKLLLKLS